MFYLRNQATGKYVSALIKLRDGQYAIYYRDDISQLDARWAKPHWTASMPAER